MKIIKSLIAPIQQRVIQKRMCAGCLKKLSEAAYREAISNDTELVLCECGRAYIYNRPHKRYRRALPEEVKQR